SWAAAREAQRSWLGERERERSGRAWGERRLAGKAVLVDLSTDLVGFLRRGRADDELVRDRVFVDELEPNRLSRAHVHCGGQVVREAHVDGDRSRAARARR